jgi:hypothetical protein
VLQTRSLAFAESSLVGKRQVDFAQLGSRKEPRVVIEVCRSIFILDELTRASELLDVARDTATLPVRPLLIAVFAGYASPEVVVELKKVCHSVIVYDPETFADTLGALFDALPNLPTEPVAERILPSTPTDLLIERIDRIEAALKNLAKDREPVYRALEAGLEAEALKQVGPRQASRRQEALRAWEQERLKIEEQINQARSKRAEEEIAQLRKLRDAGESARRRSVDLVTSLGGSSVWASLFFSGYRC